MACVVLNIQQRIIFWSIVRCGRKKVHVGYLISWWVLVFVMVCKLSCMHIHVWRQTWPFTFSSRTGGGAAVPQSLQLPRSTPCDVARSGGVASPGHVTSTAKVKVKVKVGADSSSSQQHPSTLSSKCWRRISWIFTTVMTSRWRRAC